MTSKHIYSTPITKIVTILSSDFLLLSILQYKSLAFSNLNNLAYACVHHSYRAFGDGGDDDGVSGGSGDDDGVSGGSGNVAAVLRGDVFCAARSCNDSSFL